MDPGNENFYEDSHSDIYVDKTGLLEVLNRSIGQSRHFFAVSRPRRFGKSMAASMIDAYHSLESYWKNTASFTQLNNYIQLNMAGLKEDIVHMLTGEHIPVDTRGYQNDLTSFTDKDDVLTALIHMGYLGFDADTEEAYIPNEEVATVFQYAIRAGSWDDLSDALSNSDALLRAIWSKDSDRVAEMIAASTRV